MRRPGGRDLQSSHPATIVRTAVRTTSRLAVSGHHERRDATHLTRDGLSHETSHHCQGVSISPHNNFKTDSESSDIVNHVTLRTARLFHLPRETVQMIAPFGPRSPSRLYSGRDTLWPSGRPATRRRSRAECQGAPQLPGMEWVRLNVPAARDTPKPNGVRTALNGKEYDADGSCR